MLTHRPASTSPGGAWRAGRVVGSRPGARPGGPSVGIGTSGGAGTAAWAREGLARFAVGHDTRLSLAAVQALLGTDAIDEALDVARSHPQAAPTPAGWRVFAAAADAAGLPASHRESVLEELVADAPVDRVVAILLDIGEVDRGWAVAERRRADRGSWWLLAEAMAPHDHARTAEVYHRELEEALRGTSMSAYNRVVDLLVHLRDLHAAAEDPDTYDPLVQRIRSQHGRRTAMLRRMDDAGL